MFVYYDETLVQHVFDCTMMMMMMMMMMILVLILKNKYLSIQYYLYFC